MASDKSDLHDHHRDAQIAAGELFIKKLESETSKSGVSTGLAIFEAQEPSEKRRALDAGIGEWAKALCAAAVEYYDTRFELGRRSGANLDGKKPADFAYGLTARSLSIFLRVSALDGAEENSDGRVRQFIRDVCGPPDVDVGNLPDLSLDPAPSQAFRLPSWAAKHTFGDRIARKPKPPSTGTLSTEQAESVILAKQTMLTSGLLEALLDAYRKALISLGMSPSSSSKQGAPIAPMQDAAPWAQRLTALLEKVVLSAASEKSIASEWGGGKGKRISKDNVHTEVSEQSPSVLLSKINRNAPRKKIRQEIEATLKELDVPSRPVDPGIFEAVEYKRKTGCSFEEASIKVFGDPDKAESIRAWYNRRENGQE